MSIIVLVNPLCVYKITVHYDGKVHCTEYWEKKTILVHKIMITFPFMCIYLFLSFLRCCKDWYLCHIYTWWVWLYLRQQSVNLHVYCKIIWLKLWCNSLSWVIVIKSFNQSVCHSQPGLDILFVCSYMLYIMQPMYIFI